MVETCFEPDINVAYPVAQPTGHVVRMDVLCKSLGFPRIDFGFLKFLPSKKITYRNIHQQ